MIKLFRNIRKNLLQEGKTAKYFKYAIGEIVLVVIGILIALQINNWNENRRLNNKEVDLVTQLLEDSRADAQFFKDRSYKLKVQTHYYKNLISHCEGMPIEKETIIFSVDRNQPFIQLASQSNLLKNNPNAYDQLVSLDLKKELQKYVSKYEFVSRSIQLFNSALGEYYESWRINNYKEMPETSDIRNYEQMRFLCDDDRNLGILKLFISNAAGAIRQTDEFVQLNMELTEELERYLEKNND
jgi:hypothetical protein